MCQEILCLMYACGCLSHFTENFTSNHQSCHQDSLGDCPLSMHLLCDEGDAETERDGVICQVILQVSSPWYLELFCLHPSRCSFHGTINNPFTTHILPKYEGWARYLRLLYELNLVLILTSEKDTHSSTWTLLPHHQIISTNFTWEKMQKLYIKLCPWE